MKGIAPWVQAHWDWRAAGNFICGGTGSGLLLFAALATLIGVPLEPLVLPAFVLVCAGLSLVWLELGRPWRFINVFFHPHTSWMTREAIVAMPLIAVGAAAVWFSSSDLALGAALLGLIFLYCQARMLQAAKGIPAWREPLAIMLLFVTGLAEGQGLFLVLAPILPGYAPRMAAIGVPSLLILIVLRMWVWASYRHKLEAGGAPIEARAVLGEMNGWFTFWGHVFPVIMIGLGLLFAPGAAFLYLLAGIFVLIGGWYAKFSIVTRAAYNQGFAIKRTPSRGGDSGPGVAPGW